jgi:hypothetical protein
MIAPMCGAWASRWLKWPRVARLTMTSDASKTCQSWSSDPRPCSRMYLLLLFTLKLFFLLLLLLLLQLLLIMSSSSSSLLLLLLLLFLPVVVKLFLMVIVFALLVSPCSKPEHYSSSCNNFLAKCLVKDPAHRQSAKEMLCVCHAMEMRLLIFLFLFFHSLFLSLEL